MMNGIRGHLLGITAATLSAQAVVLALAITVVCSRGPHRHAGAVVTDCAMHHHDESQRTPHAHHDDASTADPGSHHDERMTCGCSNDLTSVYVGPAGEMPVAATASPWHDVVIVARAAEPSVAEFRLPPFSPPPRATFSHLS